MAERLISKMEKLEILHCILKFVSDAIGLKYATMCLRDMEAGLLSEEDAIDWMERVFQDYKREGFHYLFESPKYYLIRAKSLKCTQIDDFTFCCSCKLRYFGLHAQPLRGRICIGNSWIEQDYHERHYGIYKEDGRYIAFILYHLPTLSVLNCPEFPNVKKKGEYVETKEWALVYEISEDYDSAYEALSNFFGGKRI